MDTYQYSDTPQTRPTGTFEPLPEGDYNFTVIYNSFAESDRPTKTEKGNWSLRLKLAVGPDQVHVFANPWSGTTSSGDKRDNIAEFLRAVGRAPANGTEPQWSKLIGAKGKCHIKTEIAKQGSLAGKPVNVVAYFIVPRDTRTATQPPTYTPQQVNESANAVRKAAHDPDLDPDPTDIPF